MVLQCHRIVELVFQFFLLFSIPNRKTTGVWAIRGEIQNKHECIQQYIGQTNQKVHMFIVLNRKLGLLWPYFIDEVNGDRDRYQGSRIYIKLPEEKVLPDLRNKAKFRFGGI